MPTLSRATRLKLALVACLCLAVILLARAIYPAQSSEPAITPPPSFPLTFTCAQAIANDYGLICVKTEPGAALTIKVTYCSGHVAESAGLRGTVSADKQGVYEWDWTPKTTCRGDASADVVARWNGIGVERETTFVVQ